MEAQSAYSRLAERAPNTRIVGMVRRLTSHVKPPFLLTWEMAKHIGRIVPGTWNRLLFRRFWGDGILSSDPYFVMDSYEDVRLRSGLRWAEGQAAAEGQARPFADSEIIHGTFSPQAAAMLAVLFLRQAGKSLRIATDTEVGHNKDATLICYGTSDSNFKTFDIEASSGSELCQFSFDGRGQRAFRVGGQLYFMEHRDGVTHDKAILLRLNSRDNPDHCHVVCAGLSEWGSLAAVSYLTRKWKSLHKRFDRFEHRRDFCVVLEVPCGQPEKAREIASAVQWRSQRQSPSTIVSARRGASFAAAVRPANSYETHERR